MPNMLSDGFIDQAQFLHTVATTPANADYQLQGTVSNAMASAALSNLLTCNVSVAAYAGANSDYALVVLLIERLVNMGYTASLSTSTLTVSW